MPAINYEMSRACEIRRDLWLIRSYFFAPSAIFAQHRRRPFHDRSRIRAKAHRENIYRVGAEGWFALNEFRSRITRLTSKRRRTFVSNKLNARSAFRFDESIEIFTQRGGVKKYTESLHPRFSLSPSGCIFLAYVSREKLPAESVANGGQTANR